VKSLALHDILRQIGIDNVERFENITIGQVMDETKKDIEDHTLLFHRDREPIKGKYWRNNRSVAVVTDRPENCKDLGDSIVLIPTDQLEAAYWKFIAYYRSLFDIPVIGITGTCGKTTTKEMIRHVLRAEGYRVKSTWMSMNSKSVNLRYLTSIEDDTEVAVFEMPVVYPGYLKETCATFQPQIRILLNIGVHHLADSETPEAYMKAKAEIAEDMDPVNGTLIMNMDDERVMQAVDVGSLRNVVYFGKSPDAHYRAAHIRYGDGGMNFTLTHSGVDYDAYVHGYGVHNVDNALAAIAALTLTGVDIKAAVQQLASFKQVKEHLEVKEGAGGCTIIDNTWNSSSLSMYTALQVLQALSEGKQSIALLGYIPQLGDGPYAIEQYEAMGRQAMDTNVGILIVVGDEARDIGIGAFKAGMSPANVYFCRTGDDVYDIVAPHLHADTVILLEVTHRVMTKSTFRALKLKLLPNCDDE